jgi:hypothetical protein
MEPVSALGIALMAGTAVGLLDKFIQAHWPNPKVNSIFDVIQKLINAIILYLEGRRKSGNRYPARPDRFDESWAQSTKVDLELFSVGKPTDEQKVQTIRNREQTGSRISRAIEEFHEAEEADPQPPVTRPQGRPPERDPSQPEYWQREDIQQWAEANPGLAAAAKQRYGIK